MALLFSSRADEANYLGSTNQYDVYTSFDGRSAILVFGNEGPEYRCMPWSFVPMLAENDLAYAMALRLGIENGVAASAGLVIAEGQLGR
jgi:hypothetical protein